MRFYLGIDIGGTKTSVCIGNENGEVLKKEVFLTLEYPQLCIEAIVNSCLRLQADLGIKQLSCGGISCGGPLDSQKGLILSPPHLAAWDRIPISKLLTDKLGLPVFIENDANACALAEWYWGNGKGCSSLVFLTFGTGFGAGLILDNKLYRGFNGQAGEIGHVRIAEDGPCCYGKRGSIEGFCSGAGLSLLYEQEFNHKLDAKAICDLAENGDEKALRIIDVSSKKLGLTLALIIDLINPQKIILGSIFARKESLFRDRILSVINEEALEINRRVCSIQAAKLGEDLGDKAALGVALMANSGSFD